MTSRRRRSTARVEPSRWAGYLLAAASTAISSQNAEADIRVIDVGIELRDSEPGNSYFGEPFMATFGSSAEGILFLHAYSETQIGYGILAVIGQRQNPSHRFSIAAISDSGSFYARRLSPGSAISNESFALTGVRCDMAWGASYISSQWPNADGYLAFRFDVGNGTQFGWMELTLDSGVPANIYRLERYAWADPGESLYAGQIPEAGSLGLLALGATGLLAWRRRRMR
ncbi:MAG: PEP-CTERM sorting domain-containing protein [Planctomycetota bacterium]